MRRLATLVVLSAACAHGPRPIVPEAWHELRSEHFTLRTNLPPEEARRTIAGLEDVRAGLLAVSWHAEKVGGTRTEVIEFADASEMQDYAGKELLGFVASDAFAVAGEDR